MERKDYLERLVMGLEMAIPENEARLKWLKPEELEFRYTQKFVAAMQESLDAARKELKELK